MNLSKTKIGLGCALMLAANTTFAGYNTVCYLTAASYSTVEGTAITGTVARQAESTTMFGDWNLGQSWNVTITVDPTGQTYPITSQDVSGTWSRSFTIPANQYSVGFSIPIADNSSLEYDRSATLRVSGTVSTQGARQSAPATVLDNDSIMYVFLVQSNLNYSSLPLYEGGINGTDRGTIGFQRCNASIQARTLYFSFSGANNGVDFTPALGSSVTFNQGSDTVDVPIRILSDSVQEGTENLRIWLTAGTYKIDPATSNATVQIIDDYPTVTVTAGVTNLPEGYYSWAHFVRNPAYVFSTNKTISYHITGTATNGVDFSFAGSTVIAAGYSDAVVYFTNFADNLVEGVKNFTVTLDPNVYTVGNPGSFTVNLLDDYATVNVAATVAIAQEQGVVPGNIRLTRSGDLNLALPVRYSVSGTARAGVDYQTLSGTATFAAGSTTVDVPVTPIDDGIYDTAHSVVLTLTADRSYLLGVSTQATVTVVSATPNPGRTPTFDGRYYRAGYHPGQFLNPQDIFWDYYSFVVPLDEEKGVNFGDRDGSVASSFVNRQWTDVRYHFNAYMALSGYSQTNLGNRTAFNNPIVAFGGSHGGSPLFIGQQYNFGIYAGTPYPNYNPVRVAVYNRSSGAYVGQVLVPVPNPYSYTSWTNYAAGGFESTIAGFGLTTTLRYVPDAKFGTSSDGCYILTHEADASSTNYYYLIESTNYVQNMPMAATSAGGEAASRLYTLEFDQRMPWRTTVADVPNFQGTPQPTEYDGMSSTELLSVKANYTNQLPSYALGYTALNQSPELRRHPLLDQLVSDLKSDPIAIANYVQNEIDLVDPAGLNMDGSLSDQILNLGGVKRGALGVYLEGEGSPMEQCTLLVYMLRQAGYPAAYMFAPPQGVKLYDQRLSKMLRVQLRGGQDFVDNAFTTNQNIAVSYPWVATYVNGTWFHLFPWLKDYEVIEGLDLRQVLPASNPSGFSWVQDYVLGKTNILSFGSPTDITPTYIFPRWLASVMQQTAPKNSVDDVGLRWKLRSQHYARWQDFPQPTWMTNAYTPIDTLSSANITNVSPRLASVFDTVTVSVYSVANPQKVIGTPELRMCDLHDRKFYIRHIVNGGGHQLQLVLGAFGLNTNGSGTFTDADLLRKQQLNLNLDGTDDKLNIRFVVNEHRAVTPDTPLPPISFLNLYERTQYAQERPLRKGDLAGICIAPGRVTKRMLDVHARELWQQEQSLNNGGTPDPDIYNGTLVYLLGMTHLERASRSVDFFYRLGKIQCLSRLNCGLSEISADRDASGNLTGTLDFRRPSLDMYSMNTAAIGNKTAHLGSGRDGYEAQRDSFILATAACSADEHQSLNVFFQETNAVSTVRLLQLAQQAATNGNPGVLFLNAANANNMATNVYQGAQLWSYDVWPQVIAILNESGGAACGFITPGPISSSTGSYKGMGFLGLGYESSISAIGQNLINGAYSSYLDTGTLGNANAGNLSIRQDADGNFYLVSSLVSGSNKSLAPDSTYSFDRDNLATAVQSGYYLTTDAQGLEGQQAVGNGIIAGSSSTPSGTLLSEEIQADYAVGNAGNVDFYSKKNGFVMDPVSPLTGEFYHDAVDLSLPGPFPIQLRRNYSSQNLADNQFGHGWRINYLPFLSINTNASVIYAAEMDGSTLGYERQGTNNIWKVTAARNPLLDNASRQGIGSTANLLGQSITLSGSTYTLSGADGSTRIYQTGVIVGAPVGKPFLTRWQDNRGNYLAFYYVTDASQPDFCELSQILSSNGNGLGFEFDAAGHIIAAYTEDGRWVDYEYDEYGDLVSVTRPDNSIIEFEYAHSFQNVTNGASVKSQSYSTHLLTTEHKPDGRLLVNQYDNQRRVTNQLSTAGTDLNPIRTATFVYANNFSITNAATNLVWGTTTIYDVFSNPLVYSYTNGQITTIVDALGIGMTNVWWQPNETNQVGYYNRSLKRSIDRRGLITDFFYDGSGNVISNVLRGDLTGAGNTNEQAVTSMTYNPNNLPLDITDPMGITTRTVYDPVYQWLPQQVIRLVRGTPVVTNWMAYCNTTNTVTNGTTVYTNLAYGVLRQHIRAYNSVDAATNEFVVDGRGFPIQSTAYTGTADPAVTLTLFHNERGELVQQQDAGGRVTLFTHDGMGRPESTEVIDETGKTVSWNSTYYNDNGEVTWTDGPAYGAEDYVWRDYDGAGRLTQLVKWRAEGNLDGSGVSQPAGDAGYSVTWNEFDGFGNVKRTVDPRGVITTNTWDAIGRLTQRNVIETNGTVLTTESFVYWPGGEERYHTNALGGTRETQYTSTGKPKYRRNEDGSTGGWRYDLSGRVVSEIGRNSAHTDTTYDDANLKTTRVFYSASGTALATAVTSMDRRGNVIQSIDPAQNVFTTVFDGLDRPKLITGPLVSSVSISNSGGISLPTPGSFVTNYLQQLTAFFYDNCGKVTTVTNATGEKTVTTRDAVGRVVSVQVFDPGAVVPTRVTTTNYRDDHHGYTVTEGTGGSAVSTTVYTDNDGQTVLSIQSPGAGESDYVLNRFDLAGNKVESDQLMLYGGQVYLWTSNSWTFDGLGRVKTETSRDNATTSYGYNALGNITSRVLPGPSNLTWSATYSAAGLMSNEWNSAAGLVTRSNTYTYYGSASPYVGLLNVAVDGSGVTKTMSYDSWLHLTNITTTGAQTNQQMTAAWQYDCRGLMTNLTQYFANGATGPATIVGRVLDAYGQLASETVTVGTNTTRVTQGWDAAGRRSQLGNNSFSIGFQYRADGLMTAADGSMFAYGDNGLITLRSNSFRWVSINQRNSEGWPLSAITHVGNNTYSESWTWNGDGTLYSYTAPRGDFTDSRTFSYGALHRRLTQETFNVAGQTVTNTYEFDRGQAGGLGVLTKAGTTNSWSAAVDAFSRVTNETSAVIHRTAFGKVNGSANLRGTLNGLSIPMTWDSEARTRWTADVALRPGTNILTVYAEHPSGAFTNSAVSQFNVATNALDQSTATRDGAGNITRRVWSNCLGQTVKTQTFTWDGFGRLIGVTERDTNNCGFNYDSVFDGLGRQLRVTETTVSNNIAFTTNPCPLVINFTYDPLVEFGFFGINLMQGAQSRQDWLVYGPDASGVYGGMQGVGGLESISTSDDGKGSSATFGIISDTFGNVLGGITNTSGGVAWNKARVSTYAPADGYAPPRLTLTERTYASLALRTRPVTIAGTLQLGLRPYDISSRSFMSFDPVWNSGDPNGFSAFRGNPGRYFDADGRLGKGNFLAVTGDGQSYQFNPYDVYYQGWDRTLNGESLRNDPLAKYSMPLTDWPSDAMNGNSFRMTFGDEASAFADAAINFNPIVSTIGSLAEVADASKAAGVASVEGSSQDQALAYSRAGVSLLMAFLSLEDPLGGAVEKPGFNRETVVEGFQDHHIISDKNAATSDHELLDLADFDLQSRANKIFLPEDASLHPTRSIHSGRHWGSVSDNLAQQMDYIVAYGKENGWTQEQYNQALRAIIAQERQMLRSGARALNSNARPGAR